MCLISDPMKFTLSLWALYRLHRVHTIELINRIGLVCGACWLYLTLSDTSGLDNRQFWLGNSFALYGRLSDWQCQSSLSVSERRIVTWLEPRISKLLSVFTCLVWFRFDHSFNRVHNNVPIEVTEKHSDWFTSSGQKLHPIKIMHTACLKFF